MIIKVCLLTRCVLCTMINDGNNTLQSDSDDELKRFTAEYVLSDTNLEWTIQDTEAPRSSYMLIFV